MKTKRVELKRTPDGMPKIDDFQIVETDMPALEDGHALVQNIYMSVDPYMRGGMRANPPGPLYGHAVGRVIQSRATQLPEGAYVLNGASWREHFAAPADQLEALRPKAPLQTYIGALGMPGFTAWYGLTQIGKPKQGETVLVSAAAGAVGSLVGQLAKRSGCYAAAVVGSEEKKRYAVEQLQYDAAVNRNGVEDLQAAVQEATPNGIDIYFENVGGKTLQAALHNINRGARIPVCGMISQYNLEQPEPGPNNLFRLIWQRAEMKGFIISDHPHLRPQFLREVEPLVLNGEIQTPETIVRGIENAPQAFIQLFTGQKLGKISVQLCDED